MPRGAGLDAGSETTLILPGRRRILPGRRRRRPGQLTTAAVVLALLVAAGAGLYIWRDSTGGNTGGSASAGPVRLLAVASYDPQGDGAEHDERIALATDADVSTFWETEHYHSQELGGLKDGVGLVLETRRSASLSKITVRSDTPGFTAQVEAGAASSGPFAPVSDSRLVGSSTTFELRGRENVRYYLIWITDLAPDVNRADINEVTAN